MTTEAWVSTSEAERLTGWHRITLNGHVKRGTLKSRKNPERKPGCGNHIPHHLVRVEDVVKLLGTKQPQVPKPVGIRELIDDGGPPPDMEDLLELLDTANFEQFDAGWVACIVDWAADGPVGLGPLAYVLTQVRERYRAGSSPATTAPRSPASGQG